MNLGRDKLDWSQDIWKQIDKAVHDDKSPNLVAVRCKHEEGPEPSQSGQSS